MSTRGIDVSRVSIAEPESIEDFRTSAVKMLTNYMEHKDAPPMMMVLDSLGATIVSKRIRRCRIW